MKPRYPIALAVTGMLFASSLWGQEPQRVVLGAYYRCDQGRESRADEIVRETWAPIFDRHVAAGNFISWGWSSHMMGTDWRRLLTTIGTDRDAMLDARGEIIEELTRDHADAIEEMGSICPSHDDYIWNSVARNPGDGPGAARLSVYYMCDISRQERADSLVTQFIGPVYDRMVEQGTINSWGWLAHRFGGKWRRLATMSGADAKSLLNAQDVLFPILQEEQPAAMDEFDQICASHDDYLWSTTIQQQ